MTGVYVALVASASAALVWLVGQLRRRPFDARLSALTGLVLLWVVSFPFGLAAAGNIAVPGLDQLGALTVQFVLRMVACYCLVLFFLFTVGPGRSARRQAVAHAVPLVAAAVAEAVLAGMVPAGLRAPTAELELGPSGIVGVGVVSAFYLVGNVYYTYAYGAALIWTRRHRREAAHPLRRGLTITACGLVLLVVSGCCVIAANVTGWLAVDLPFSPALLGLALFVPGTAIFLVGLLYPAARMRLAAFGVWREHRRTLLRLQPLWRLLHREFPETALDAGSPGLALWSVHRRYYRCLVECRDGLLRLSPYLAAQSGDVAPDAAAFHRALAARRGAPVSDRGATLVAAPRGDSRADDEAQLVALADTLARA